ncbi:conserved hypothetical protein [Methylocella tundrae]|uniref:DUF2158 domain-containing protein n=1 Tax=Methylocella tundrae TaxID=227605 RepID=A0A8B6M5R9_METTU|nr:conserved hypothetical protein [Methylocella tundrae]
MNLTQGSLAPGCCEETPRPVGAGQIEAAFAHNMGGKPLSETSIGSATFEPGDIVQLKSFGPAMTVVSVDAEGVHVLWYGEATDELKTHVIPAIALEKITVLDEDEDEEDEDDEDDDRKGKQAGKKKRRRDD